MAAPLLRYIGFFLFSSAVGVALLEAQQKSQQKSGPPPFTVVEATIPEMMAAMEAKRITSRDLVAMYLTRIGLYEDRLHAAITVNPNALQEADERDRERSQGRIRGPLHGIPIALKARSPSTDSFLPTTRRW